MTAPCGSSTEVVFRSEIAQIALVRDALERIGAEHGIAPEALIALHVAIDEVLSNVVNYAWPQGGDHEIQVRIGVDAGQVRIEIIDDGAAFDPLAAPAQARASPGKRPRPGGVGIRMLKQLVDGIEYARIGGRNHLTLTKRRSAGKSNVN